MCDDIFSRGGNGRSSWGNTPIGYGFENGRSQGYVCSYVREIARELAMEMMADPEGFRRRQANLHANRIVDALARRKLVEAPEALRQILIDAILCQDEGMESAP